MADSGGNLPPDEGQSERRTGAPSPVVSRPGASGSGQRRDTHSQSSLHKGNGSNKEEINQQEYDTKWQQGKGSEKPSKQDDSGDPASKKKVDGKFVKDKMQMFDHPEGIKNEMEQNAGSKAQNLEKNTNAYSGNNNMGTDDPTNTQDLGVSKPDSDQKDFKTEKKKGQSASMKAQDVSASKNLNVMAIEQKNTGGSSETDADLRQASVKHVPDIDELQQTEDGSLIVIDHNKKSGMVVYIETLSEGITDCTAINVEPRDTTGMLKLKIKSQMSISPDEQRLVFQGNILEDGKNLSDYNICHQSKIHLPVKTVKGSKKTEGNKNEQTPRNTMAAFEQEKIGGSLTQHCKQFDEVYSELMGRQKVETYISVHPFTLREPGDLTFKAKEIITVTQKEDDRWTGSIGDRHGSFPSSFVKLYKSQGETGEESSLEDTKETKINRSNFMTKTQSDKGEILTSDIAGNVKGDMKDAAKDKVVLEATKKDQATIEQVNREQDQEDNAEDENLEYYDNMKEIKSEVQKEGDLDDENNHLSDPENKTSSDNVVFDTDKATNDFKTSRKETIKDAGNEGEDTEGIEYLEHGPGIGDSDKKKQNAVTEQLPAPSPESKLEAEINVNQNATKPKNESGQPVPKPRRSKASSPVKGKNEQSPGPDPVKNSNNQTEETGWRYNNEAKQEIKYGDTLHMVMPFSGSKPSVKVFYNGEQLEDSSLKGEFTEGTIHIRLEDLSHTDGGKYEMHVKNSTGEGRVVVLLSVSDFQHGDGDLSSLPAGSQTDSGKDGSSQTGGHNTVTKVRSASLPDRTDLLNPASESEIKNVKAEASSRKRSPTSKPNAPESDGNSLLVSSGHENNAEFDNLKTSTEDSKKESVEKRVNSLNIAKQKGPPSKDKRAESPESESSSCGPVSEDDVSEGGNQYTSVQLPVQSMVNQPEDGIRAPQGREKMPDGKGELHREKPGQDMNDKTSVQTPETIPNTEMENKDNQFELEKTNGMYFLVYGSNTKLLGSLNNANEVKVVKNMIFADKNIFKIFIDAAGNPCLKAVDNVRVLQESVEPLSAESDENQRKNQTKKRQLPNVPTSEAQCATGDQKEAVIYKDNPSERSGEKQTPSPEGRSSEETCSFDKAASSSNRGEEMENEKNADDVDVLISGIAALNVHDTTDGATTMKGPVQISTSPLPLEKDGKQKASPDSKSQSQDKKKKHKSLDVEVRVYHGELSQLFHVPSAIFGNDCLKLWYLLGNEKASNELNSRLKTFGIQIRKKQVLITLKEKEKQEVILETVKKFLRLTLDKISDLHIEENKLEKNGEEILERIKNSHLGRNCLLYAQYFENEQLLVYVCKVEDQGQVHKEYLKALEPRNTDQDGEVVKDFTFNLGFDIVCGLYTVSDTLSSKFPGVRLQCQTDYEKKICECSLLGPTPEVVEKALGFLQNDIVNEHPCNSIPFSDIQKIEMVGKKEQQEILERELRCLISEYDKPEEFNFNINTEAKRVTVVGPSQSIVDKICTKLRGCIEEIKLDLSHEAFKRLLSEIKTEDKNRMSFDSSGNSYHCVGSADVIKLLTEQSKRYTKESKENLDRKDSQDLSLNLYLPKTEKKSKTVELKDINVFKLLKHRLQQGSFKAQEGVEIVDIENKGKFGFMITCYDGDSLHEAEMFIKKFEADSRDEPLSVQIKEKQENEFDLIKLQVEEKCSVVIKREKPNNIPKAVHGEEFNQRQMRSKSKECIFPNGIKLKVSLGNADEHWENLLVEITHKKGEPSVIQETGGKMMTSLYVPVWGEGEPGEDDGTHAVQKSVERVLEQMESVGCTHVCLPLDCRHGWPLRKFTKQILKSFTAYIEGTDVVPVVFEMCLSKMEEFKDCSRITFKETLKMKDFESDEEDPPAIPERRQDRKPIQVCVVSGFLHEFKADVLVNTTSQTLDLDNGAVSRSLSKGAGEGMQNECRVKYRRGIKEGAIAVTEGHNLYCKNVFHGSIKEYKEKHGKACLQKLGNFILACLEKAVDSAHTSIAFPAIGTGNLEYPIEKVAEVMFDSVKVFAEGQELKGGKKILDVYFVIYPADCMDIFQSFNKEFIEGRKQKPVRPGPPTSSCVTLSNVTVNAMIGDIKTCGTAESLIYFWENMYRGDTLRKQKPFITSGGRLGNHRIIHVPVKNVPNALMQGFRDGIMAAENAESVKAAVLFKKGSPFLVYQEKLGREMIEAVKDVAGRLKHLKSLTLVIEGLPNPKKLFSAFETVSRNNEEAQMTPDEKTISIDLMITGYQEDIEQAKHMICQWSHNKEWKPLGNKAFRKPPGAYSEEPGTQKIERTEFRTPDHREMPPAGKSYLCKRESLSGYVEVSNIPKDQTFATLSVTFLKAGLPVGIKLLFPEGCENALIICNSSEDAEKLSGCEMLRPIAFRCIERKALGHFQYVIKETDVIRMQKAGTLDTFRKKLEELKVDVNETDEFRVHAETSQQISWTIKLKEMYCDEIVYTTTSADGFEHVVPKTIIDDIQPEIIGDEVPAEIWKILHVEKEEKIKEFQKTCGTLSYDGKTIIAIRKTESCRRTFSDFIEVFTSFVKKIKKMEIEELDIDAQYKDDIHAWMEEIDSTMKQKCCIFIPNECKIIVYVETYEEKKQVKHHFLFKQKKIKPTGRRRKVAQEDNSESGPSSLQAGYMLNAEDNDSCSRYTKIADFEWKRDAKNVETYKTDENIQVYVYEADILNLPVDCIVNAANDTLNHGGGVAKAIADGAGKMLNQEGKSYIRSHGKIPVGHAMSTTAGNLPYKYVIHTVGPRWGDYWPHSFKDISRCENALTNAVYNSFLEAEKHNLTKIALPAISAAIFGVPEELCVSMYVRATLKYSQDRTAAPVNEIHFIDKNPEIIALLQNEFDTVLTKGEVSPYLRKSNRDGQRNDNQVSDHAGLLSEQISLVLSPEHKLTSDKKDIFFFCGNEDKGLLIYSGNILSVKDSAIVVTIDERKNEGSIARSVTRNIPENRKSAYRHELGKNLPQYCSTGTLAVTRGYSTGFSRILHVVFPTNAQRKNPTERRKDLKTAYHNIFMRTVCDEDVRAISTTLIGIDDAKQDEVDMCADVFLEEYVSFVKEKLLERKGPFNVFLVCRQEKVAKRICSKFKEFVGKQQKLFQDMGNQPEDPVSNDEEQEDCVICMEAMKNVETLKCGHKYCKECIDQHFKIKKTCPTCGAVCGVITGDQPDGRILVGVNHHAHCEGYHKCGQIYITYTFPDGRQQQNHPNPGKWYKGITRTAYLPDNKEGRKIRDMLMVAFDRKLVFTIGSSRTTGHEGVITWNDIHHKTDPRPYTQFGYPDETYLTRVKEELEAKGVTEKDIK